MVLLVVVGLLEQLGLRRLVVVVEFVVEEVVVVQVVNQVEVAQVVLFTSRPQQLLRVPLLHRQVVEVQLVVMVGMVG